MLKEAIHNLFLIYTIMLFVRILGSWVPQWRTSSWMHFVGFYTDPYLSLFKRVLPPLGGVLDLSPMIAFFVLQFFEKFLLAFF